MANYEEPSLLDFSGNYLHASVQVSFTCALVILHFYLRVCVALCVCVSVEIICLLRSILCE